jgi:hypothetical protein
MIEKKAPLNRVNSKRKYHVGRVTIYLRGKIWYIYYCENGQRVRRRVGVSAPGGGTMFLGYPKKVQYSPLTYIVE